MYGDSPENPAQVRKLPTSLIFLGWLVVGTVLILAREEVVAALLGMMVEVRGLQPMFLGPAEAAEDAILREKPKTVIIDCDHPDCRDTLVEAILRVGAVPVLFSPSRMQAEVRSVAARHGIRSFTLLTDTDAFGRMLDS